MKTVNRAIKNAIRMLLPISARQSLSIWLIHQNWLEKKRRFWLAQEILKDWAKKDVLAFHKFLWANHLGYAETYETDLRFGYENFNESRKILFKELEQHLDAQGIDPRRDIHSVFEVGCSLGYLLRHMEKDLFHAGKIFEGIDIDRQAIEGGRKYLKSVGSKVNLICGDMETLPDIMKGKVYDIILCPGVLMYLDYEHASTVVKTMLNHCKIMVALAGLAHPKVDNSVLRQSDVRKSDSTFIHNIDSMVKEHGGNILARRWEGGKVVDGNTIYFIFARKPTDNRFT